MTQEYLVALGSNMRVPGIGAPRAVVVEALEALRGEGMQIVTASPIVETRPVGPSARRYANAAAVIEARLDPPRLLRRLQSVEDAFGRRRRGERWRARTLDLDIVLWSGGEWSDSELAIPHPLFRERGFVLAPAAAIAPRWRDPVSGLSLAQLQARLTRPRPLPR